MKLKPHCPMILHYIFLVLVCAYAGVLAHRQVETNAIDVIFFTGAIVYPAWNWNCYHKDEYLYSELRNELNRLASKIIDVLGKNAGYKFLNRKDEEDENSD